MPCPVGVLPRPCILYVTSVFILPGPIFIVEDGEGGDDKIGFGLLVG
jgi:hypothetical protein